MATKAKTPNFYDSARLSIAEHEAHIAWLKDAIDTHERIVAALNNLIRMTEKEANERARWNGC